MNGTITTVATAAASPHDADTVSVTEVGASVRLSLQPFRVQPSRRTIAFATPPATSVRHGPEWVTVGAVRQAGHPVRSSPLSVLYDSSGQYVVQDVLGATYGVGASPVEALADFFSALGEYLAFLRANEARLHPGLQDQLTQLHGLFPGR